MEETREAILAEASNRVLKRLALWMPMHREMQEIKSALIASLPAVIEDRDEA